MTILLLLGTSMVLTAIYLVANALPRRQPEGINRSLAVLEAMTDAPEELTSEIDRPFSERVLEPLQARAGRLGRRFTGADTADRYRVKLDLAGNPPGWTVDRVISGKVIGAVVGLVV